MNKQRVLETIDRKATEFRNISREIGNRPELGHEEYYASGLLGDLLEREGFDLERGVLGLETAFRDAAMTERALDRMIVGAKLLAATAYDVMADERLRDAIRAEFLQRTSTTA